MNGSSWRGRPKYVLGWKWAPLRITMSASSRCWATSTARSQPELPAPTTSTREPVEIADVVVLAGVDLFAGEVTRHLGHLRVPQVAVGHQHAVIDAGAAAGGDGPPAGTGSPSVCDRAHRLHLGVELDHALVGRACRAKDAM